jgi:ABC-type transport system involved in cytochrome c biogenesis permease subunit
MRRLFEAMASLRFTVVLLALSAVLVFAGTLAQVRDGVWTVVNGYFRSPVAWIDLQLFVPPALGRVDAAVPFPGGATLGLAILLNLMAAHWLRFRLTARRLGVVVLHAGLIVLLLGEFGTALWSDEGMMSIDVGGSSNHVDDMRRVELAFLDPSDPEHDRVVAIPQGMLEKAAATGSRINDPRLPVAVEVDRWMPNARLLRADGPTPADQGVGREAEPEEIPRARGVDGAEVDVPAAYIKLYDQNRLLGTWLVSADLSDYQPVEAAAGTMGVALRFRRTYRPYTLHLLEFRHDKFTGTEIARNFSSRVRLVDPERGTDRELVIWMNNPLRHAGETFYQASYKPDGSGTVLQVVRNPAAWVPYAASALVGIGMTWHFLLGLIEFRRRRPAAATADTPVAPPRHRWALGAGVALGLLVAGHALMRPAPRAEHDLNGFAELPVSAGGRIKPMDTAARHVVTLASGRQSVRHEGERIAASQFLLDLVARPEAVRDLPILRVDHPDVLALMGLRPEDAGRLSLATVEPHWETLVAQAQRAQEVPPRRRDAFQRAVIALVGRVNQVLAHAALEEPYGVPPLGPEGEWQPFDKAFAASEATLPPGHPGGGAIAPPHPAVAYYVAMFSAYSAGDVAGFNRAVAGYRALLWRDMPGVMRQARLEVIFNRANLFMGATVVYTLAFLLLAAGMLPAVRQGGGGVRALAVGLLVAGVLIHTVAIVARIWLQGRPPVTNLYSSAVFVGWAAVLLGLLLERLHPHGVAALGASVVGFATLVVAHNLGTDGDTMQMMQAVLDSNFWLATHVVTITLGYSATFLAGALGVVYLVMGVVTRHLTAERGRALARMVYGVVCFALLLSFVGTVLGGIWADQSWGRFWGWDPKENGAALVVLLNAIILHARWGGMVRERGVMVLAVAGNVVTAWSWFGTNMLGVGLHSYGFMDSAVAWLLVFVASQLAVMALGLLPREIWRSRGA